MLRCDRIPISLVEPHWSTFRTRIVLRDFPSCAEIESTLGLFLAHWGIQRSGPHVVPAAISQPESPDLDEFQRRFIWMWNSQRDDIDTNAHCFYTRHPT